MVVPFTKMAKEGEWFFEGELRVVFYVQFKRTSHAAWVA